MLDELQNTKNPGRKEEEREANKTRNLFVMHGILI